MRGTESQKIVKHEKIPTLSQPVLLDTTGMFLAHYPKVGDDMFVASKPTERALRRLKAQGVTTVVNLRMPAEMERIGFEEQKLVTS